MNFDENTPIDPFAQVSQEDYAFPMEEFIPGTTEEAPVDEPYTNAPVEEVVLSVEGEGAEAVVKRTEEVPGQVLEDVLEASEPIDPSLESADPETDTPLDPNDEPPTGEVIVSLEADIHDLSELWDHYDTLRTTTTVARDEVEDIARYDGGAILEVLPLGAVSRRASAAGYSVAMESLTDSVARKISNIIKAIVAALKALFGGKSSGENSASKDEISMAEAKKYYMSNVQPYVSRLNKDLSGLGPSEYVIKVWSEIFMEALQETNTCIHAIARNTHHTEISKAVSTSLRVSKSLMADNISAKATDSAKEASELRTKTANMLANNSGAYPASLTDPNKVLNLTDVSTIIVGHRSEVDRHVKSALSRLDKLTKEVEAGNVGGNMPTTLDNLRALVDLCKAHLSHVEAWAKSMRRVVTAAKIANSKSQVKLKAKVI